MAVQSDAYWFLRYCELSEQRMQDREEINSLLAQLWQYRERERREQQELDKWCEEHEAEFLQFAEAHSHSNGLCD